MKRIAWGVTGFSFIFASACAPAPAADASLYERLGGYDAIAGVTDDFLDRLVADTAIKPYFEGLPDSVMKRIRQHVVDQLCEATGGPCFYIGRTMQSTHRGLGITDEHFKQAGVLMMETLDKFKIAEPERSEFLGLVEKLRPDIVEPKAPAAAATQQ